MRGRPKVDDLRRRWTSARLFLTDGEIWSAELEPRTWAARGLRVLQFVVMVAQGFVRDHLLLRASALTYFTVLSLIPIIAVALLLANALMGETSNFAQIVVERIAAGSPESQAKILDLIARARENLPTLGGVGAVVLFLTTVLGIANIERSLNQIWGVRQQRSMGRRFTDYLAVLVLAPLLLTVGLSLAGTLKSQWVVQQLIEVPGFALLYDLGLRQTPKVVLALAFAFLYWFLPNTGVRPVAALLGGLVAGVLVDLAQTLYLDFSVRSARWDTFFGGFAQLPLLLVWIFVFWAIVLFGAEVAFAYQNLSLYRRQVGGRDPGPAEREAVGLRLVVEVGRAFRDSAPPWDADELSEMLDVPVRTVRKVLGELQESGIVSTVSADVKEGGVQLGRPAERIAVTDVLAALRGEREPMEGDPDVATTVETLLAELHEGEAKAAAGHTLADLLNGIPARS